MTIQSVSLTALLPVIVVVVGALLILVLDTVVHDASRWLGWMALAVTVLATATLPAAVGKQSLCRGDQCAFAMTHLATNVSLIVLVASALVILLSLPSIATGNVPAGEFLFLLLASLAGALAVPATQDLVTLLIVLEVATLPTFALVALHGDDPRSGEGAVKIFVFSLVSLAVSLYGAALLYGVIGTLRLADIRASLDTAGTHTVVTATGVVLLLTVFLFKIAAVPVHVWAPDTYQAAPVPIAAYLSVVSKIAGFGGLFVVVSALAPWPQVWAWPLAFAAVGTLVVGNVAALRQRDAVRLLAWSSIAQGGFVLVPLAAATGPGASTLSPISVAVGYLAVYAAMNLGAFGVVEVVAGVRRDPPLSLFDGLSRQRPVWALALAFFLAALAGLPPGLSGLFAKFAAFAVPFATGAWWLGLLAAAATVVGLVYYLWFAARLFRRTGPELTVPPPPAPVAVAVATAAVLTVVFSVVPALLYGFVAM